MNDLDSAVVARLRAAGCVFAEDEARLLIAAARTSAERDALVTRRVAGEPLEHLLGFVEFAGLRIRVAPGVFVPRRRTAALAERAASLLSPGQRMLDLCCGAGAIAAVVADRVPGSLVFAADIEPEAVRCARTNLPADRVFEGNLFEPVPPQLRGGFAVIAVNAPYVPTDAIALMPPEARLHEPAVALDGGADGLDLHRRVADTAPDWLAPGGALLIETSDQQAERTAALLSAAGLSPQIESDDTLDATIVVAFAPASRTPDPALPKEPS